MRMLITGISGFLGGVTARRASAAGWAVSGTYFGNPADRGERLDIRDRRAVDDLVRRARPDVVVHTAAGREDWPLIADGSAYVALAAAGAGARLVHVSTEAIFSGRDGEYDEDALPDPIYRYGAAKAAAETAVRAIDPSAAVVRTSLILGHGRGLPEKLTHDLAAGRANGLLFTDQIRKPVHVDDLADALIELAGSDYAGVLNVAGADAISRYGLGLLVAERDGLDPAAIPHGPMPPGLTLPADIRLTIDRATGLLRTRLRGCREFVPQDAPSPA
ncbi:sugar nucleotide-binding protein [Actinoplanes sp. KI2]|uniref:SDR family oxidoreductase n=1 Tax=Actinoplanes sp. KI2 TaxID=2983315 RepID=UPI0021D5EB72|nr:sugar nucleotide-binding protein [Actinoplanes sp. KI2]MCU7726114.1 sugar nucleotide-binding protein [Actinoplanes sp. KI2]